MNDAPPGRREPSDPWEPRAAGGTARPPRRTAPRATPEGIPLAELGERDASGVSRLDIAWRAAEVLATRRRPPLPRWVDGVVVAVLVVYLLAGALSGFRAAPFGVAEAAQLALTKDAGVLVTRPLDLVPGGDTSQPAESLRLVQGAFTRYTAAAGWYLAGGRAADVPSLPVTAPPDEDQLEAARAAPALLAAAAVPLLLLLGRRVGGRRVALVAVLAVFLHPAVLLAGRQVQDVGAVLASGLATVLVAVVVSDRLAAGHNPGVGRWTALAVLGGCTLAAGQGALGFVAGAVAWVLAGFGEAYVHNRRALLAAGPAPRTPPLGTPVRAVGAAPGGPLTPPGGIPRLVAADAPDRPDGLLPAGAPWSFGLSLAGAVFVWVALSPSLWGWLPERIATRGDERDDLIAQGLLPGTGDLGHLGALWRTVRGPFLDRADAVPADRWWEGVAFAGWALPLGVLLAVATLAGVALLGLRLATGPEVRGSRRPAGGLAEWRWLGAEQVGRRDAAALLVWAAGVAACAVAWPSERSADRVPLVPVAALIAAVALVVVARRLTGAWRELARRTAERATARAS